MNDALTRLRAADPALATHPDAHDTEARAVLDHVLSTPSAPAAPVRRRRRVIIGVAGAAAAAATAAFFIASPAAAYTVDKRADGSVAVSFRPDQLRNPAKLNAELARAGARTVVIKMVPPEQCTAPLDIDPAYRFTTTATPEDLERFPVSYALTDESLVITIRPAKIPAGETLAFGFSIRNDRGGRTTMAVPAVVSTLPSCMAIPTPPHR